MPPSGLSGAAGTPWKLPLPILPAAWVAASAAWYEEGAILVYFVKYSRESPTRGDRGDELTKFLDKVYHES